MLRPLCACSTIFCFYLLLFPRCFYHCKLVLFHPTTYLFCPCLFFVEKGMGSWACLIFFCLFSNFVFFLLHVFSTAGLVLFLHTFPAMFVISFYLTSFFLHAVPSANHSLFLSIISFHISFHSYPFIKKDLGLCGPSSVYGIKRLLTQFPLFCQSHSTKDLYFAMNLYFVANHFPMHFSLSPAVSLGFCFFSVFFLPFLLFNLLGGPLGFALYWVSS